MNTIKKRLIKKATKHRKHIAKKYDLNKMSNKEIIALYWDLYERENLFPLFKFILVLEVINYMKRLIRLSDDQNIRTFDKLLKYLNTNKDHIYDLLANYIIDNFDEKEIKKYINVVFDEDKKINKENFLGDDALENLRKYLIFNLGRNESFMKDFFHYKDISIDLSSQNLKDLIEDISIEIMNDYDDCNIFNGKEQTIYLEISEYIKRNNLTEKYFGKIDKDTIFNGDDNIYSIRQLKNLDDSIGDAVYTETLDLGNRDDLFVVCDNNIVIHGDSEYSHYGLIQEYMEKHQNENEKYKNALDIINEGPRYLFDRADHALDEVFNSYCFGHIKNGIAIIDSVVNCKPNDVTNALKSELNVEKIYDNVSDSEGRVIRIARKKRLIHK